MSEFVLGYATPIVSVERIGIGRVGRNTVEVADMASENKSVSNSVPAPESTVTVRLSPALAVETWNRISMISKAVEIDAPVSKARADVPLVKMEFMTVPLEPGTVETTGVCVVPDTVLSNTVTPPAPPR